MGADQSTSSNSALDSVKNFSFKDTREIATKTILKQALANGLSSDLRKGISLVEEEYRSETLKKNKEGGSSSLLSISHVILYLSEPLKADKSMKESNAEMADEERSNDKKTPLMHALDYNHLDLANTIKLEIAKYSKKKSTLCTDESDAVEIKIKSEADQNFDRSALAKQRLMAAQNRRVGEFAVAKGENHPDNRKVVDANSMMSEEEKAMMAKFKF